MDIYVVGDIHAGYRENKRYSHKDKLMSFNKSGIVISLGDFGYPWFNSKFYLNYKNKSNVIIPSKNSEIKFFKKINKKHFILYVVLGNHEGIYRYLDKAKLSYDKTVNGYIYIFNIFNRFTQSFYEMRVFKRLGIYQIDDFKFLTIGGAYSSDRNRIIGETLFLNEEVNNIEISNFIKKNINNHFNAILTHACPIALMIDWIEENINDNDYQRLNEKINCKTSKELNKLYFKGNFDSWYFGHLHLDKTEIIDDLKFTCLFNQKPLKIN